MTENKIIIYTDGSSSGNPGPGGWAAVVIFKKEVVELGGGEKNTTNNRMELTAAIKALEFIYKLKAKSYKLILYTDAEYVLKGVTQWARNWQKSSWRTKARKPVLNQDLWRELINLEMKIGQMENKIEWKLVPAHAGVALNERCDKIAVAFSLAGKPALFRGSLADYEKFLGRNVP